MKRARRKMITKGSPHTFKATVNASGNPPSFTLDSKLKSGSNGELKFNKKDNGMKSDDYYVLQFTLNDQTGLGLEFEPNPMDAFWVAMGDQVKAPPCPLSPSYDDSIYVTSDDGTTLSVVNYDDVVQYFTFSLNFIDRNGNPYCFDPVGSNQNGGTSKD